MGRMASGIPLEDASLADVAYELFNERDMPTDAIVSALVDFMEAIGIEPETLADYLAEQHDITFGITDNESEEN